MRKRGGFSLAEVLLAFLMLTISAIFVMAMYTTGIRDYTRMGDVQKSFNLAQGKMEALMNCPLDQVVAAQSYFEGPDSDYFYRVDVNNFGSDGKRVEVTVSKGPHIRRSLSGLRAPNNTPRGLRVFLSKDCTACHQVPSANIQMSDPQAGMQGPDLGKLSPTVENYKAIYGDLWSDSQAYLVESIHQPGVFLAPGFDQALMDNYTTESISDDEIEAIHEWLESLP